MAITDVSVKWTEIGCTVLSESSDSSTRKVSRLFAPLIKYDDRKNKKAYCYEINKDDFVAIFVDPGYFVVETKDFYYIFDDMGEIKAKTDKGLAGYLLYLQEDSFVSTKDNKIVKIDLNGQVCKEAPAAEFLTADRLDAFKAQFPAVYERMQKCNLTK